MTEVIQSPRDQRDLDSMRAINPSVDHGGTWHVIMERFGARQREGMQAQDFEVRSSKEHEPKHISMYV